MKNKQQGTQRGSQQGSQWSKQGLQTQVTEQAGCGKVITETFTPNDPTVSCTRCGAESHNPSMLCSPSTTLASSTQTRESASGSSSGSSYGKSSGGFSSQSSGSKKGSHR